MLPLCFVTATVIASEVPVALMNGCINGHGEDAVVEKGEVESTKEDKEKEQEVVFIQDMGFTVKIHSPGTEPFDIQ
ncbi:unnamed protein product, partial [Timema podura]|nr:unnamed protein product [Timema podura]